MLTRPSAQLDDELPVEELLVAASSPPQYVRRA
jgi:hypothetical protein